MNGGYRDYPAPILAIKRLYAFVLLCLHQTIRRFLPFKRRQRTRLRYRGRHFDNLRQFLVWFSNRKTTLLTVLANQIIFLYFQTNYCRSNPPTRKSHQNIDPYYQMALWGLTQKDYQYLLLFILLSSLLVSYLLITSKNKIVYYFITWSLNTGRLAQLVRASC